LGYDRVNNYIVFLKADVLEQGAVFQAEILVLLVADVGRGVADHLPVDVQLVGQEVSVEEQAHAQRYPSLERGRVEVYPLH